MPKHYTSAAPILELHKAWVVSVYTGVDSKRWSAAAIGRQLGVSKASVQNALRRWGVKRERLISQEDHDTLIELADTMSIRELAEKWGVSFTHMQRTLEGLGITLEGKGSNQKPMPIMKLSEFYTCWVDVTERTVVTVNKRPRFIVVPLEQYDE